jgi:antitoxin CcdA
MGSFMPVASTKPDTKRRSVNLTIRRDVIETAKALKLNASKAAEAGIMQAIQQTQSEQWIRDNQSALSAHNQRINQNGPLLTPGWAQEN